MSVASLLRAEIAAHGPIPFSRFMQAALYDPQHGYYRQDHFGREGDYFTAEQLQPTFGLLLRRFCNQHGLTTIVQPGAGRAALADSFAGLHYTPIDIAYGAWPESFSGLVLAHEFFDALPVDVARRGPSGWQAALVDCDGQRFHWCPGPTLSVNPIDDRIEQLELPVHLTSELTRLATHLTSGHLLVIDYGYTDRERLRFPQGSLLSYRHHRTTPDVLLDPGHQDITAHVPWTTLEAHAHALGFRTVAFETLSSFLLRIGEADQLAFLALDAHPARRLQLKSLLFDIGENFQVLWLEKGENPSKQPPK